LKMRPASSLRVGSGGVPVPFVSFSAVSCIQQTAAGPRRALQLGLNRSHRWSARPLLKGENQFQFVPTPVTWRERW
jgi:hypothetical protein